MKQYFYILVTMLFACNVNAQIEVELDTSDPIFGFANVFETPANGGGYVFGGPWGIPDLKSVIDAPASNNITLQPNFNTWNPNDSFWVVNGMANKWFEANTYFEDNSLVGQEFSFVGGCIDYTLDPGYTVFAFIKVFNGNFSVLKQENVVLVPGENFEVTYTNVEPEDTFVQYGFLVFGPIADPANEPTLGSVIVAGKFPNDACANATEILCGQTLSGDTSNDTDTNGDGSPDEWFKVTSTVAGELITVSTCDQAGFDTILTVYDSCGGAVVATNDDGPGCTGFTSELSFVADGSSTYYIAVDGFGGAGGTFDLSVSCGPINDNPCGAIAIECGVPVFGNTDTATDDSAAAPTCDTTTTAPGIWYIYEDTSGLPANILVSTCSASTDYDTKISVYTGDCGTLPLTCVAGNDDSPNCTNFQSEVEFQSDGNTTFYILVHGFSTGTGNFELNMTCDLLPPPNDMIANSIDVDELGFPYTDTGVVMQAATIENGNPTGCNIDGGKGVWYNFVSAGNGTATAEVVSPAGASFVVFFTAPDENAIETDLEYFFQIGNQCAPGTSASINTAAGQTYYLFVVNDGGQTDITIDGTLLSTDENSIQGFSFYPNPTGETLNLSSIESIEDVVIYNLLGQQVIGQDVNATSLQLDTSSLATGAYLMKVTVNGQTGTYKLIKK